MQWKVDGGYGASCDDCKVIAGSSLNCQCHLTGRDTKNTTLDLGTFSSPCSKLQVLIDPDEHIGNYNGHLLSDLSGTPVVPATSSLAVPTDFSWSLTIANVGCYSTDPSSNLSVCRNNTITESECSDNTPAFTSGGAPIKCYNLRYPVSAPVWGEYEKAMIKSASKAIEFTVYDNAACTGTPIGSVKPSEDDTCKKFPTAVRGIAYKALWNADTT